MTLISNFLPVRFLRSKYSPAEERRLGTMCRWCSACRPANFDTPLLRWQLKLRLPGRCVATHPFVVLLIYVGVSTLVYPLEALPIVIMISSASALSPQAWFSGWRHYLQMFCAKALNELSQFGSCSRKASVGGWVKVVFFLLREVVVLLFSLYGESGGQTVASSCNAIE